MFLRDAEKYFSAADESTQKQFFICLFYTGGYPATID
jgi:hypothetical protein